MKTFRLEKTQLSPEITLDKTNNIFEISGKSGVENAFDFYKPIIDWFIEYFKTPNENTEINFHLEYLNSASSVQIGNLINLFTINKDKCKISINWFHEFDDELMYDVGIEFQYMYEIKFNFKAIKEDSDRFQF